MGEAEWENIGDLLGCGGFGPGEDRLDLVRGGWYRDLECMSGLRFGVILKFRF